MLGLRGNRFRAGALRDRVEIQTLSGTTTAGSRGQTQKTFSTVERTRANIKQLRGDEAIRVRQIIATATHSVVMRYTSTAAVDTRLKFGARIFGIKAVDNIDERNRWLELTCAEEL